MAVLLCAKSVRKKNMKVIVSRTNKKIVSMKLDECGNLLVTANNRLSLSEIKDIVGEKSEWIAARKKCAVPTCQTTSDANVGVDVNSQNDIADIFCGRKTLICGEVFSVKDSSGSKSSIEGDSVLIPEKYFSSKESRLKALRTCIKKYSTQSVSEAISRFGSYVSLCPSAIEFRSIPKGWLKCTSPFEKIITFDFRICQLPEHLQHYLIVHAFSHFTCAGHDGNFWNTVSNYMPNYKSCVEELQSYNFLKEI